MDFTSNEVLEQLKVDSNAEQDPVSVGEHAPRLSSPEQVSASLSHANVCAPEGSA